MIARIERNKEIKLDQRFLKGTCLGKMRKFYLSYPVR